MTARMSVTILLYFSEKVFYISYPSNFLTKSAIIIIIIKPLG